MHETQNEYDIQRFSIFLLRVIVDIKALVLTESLFDSLGSILFGVVTRKHIDR